MDSKFIGKDVGSSRIKIEENFIEVSPPSEIDAQKAVDEIDHSKITKRSPNGFIIFRKQVCDKIKSEGIKVRGNVSQFIGPAWNNLPEPTKQAYKRKAGEMSECLIKKRRTNFSESIQIPGSPILYNFEYYEHPPRPIKESAILFLTHDQKFLVEDWEEQEIKSLEFRLPQGVYEEIMFNYYYAKFINEQ